MSMFPYHNVKNPKWCELKKKKLHVMHRYRWTSKSTFLGQNLMKYSLLKFNAYDLLNSCKNQKMGIDCYWENLCIHRKMERSDGRRGSKGLLRSPLCRGINKARPISCPMHFRNSIKIKVNLNFYSRTFLWCLKRFYEIF